MDQEDICARRDHASDAYMFMRSTMRKTGMSGRELKVPSARNEAKGVARWRLSLPSWSTSRNDASRSSSVSGPRA